MPNAAHDPPMSLTYEDFDPERLDKGINRRCPVRECIATLELVDFGKRKLPCCPTHKIRLHSNTFAYINALDRQEEDPRLRNFVFDPQLAKAVALTEGNKAETHRLGHEMSEDALSWNVFVYLKQAGRLRQAAEHLTGRHISREPDLYLWCRRIDCVSSAEMFEPLRRVRCELERGIKRFLTEPDVMLFVEGELLVCIEAKFGSGNTLAGQRTAPSDVKPNDRDGLLARYLGESSSKQTRESIDRAHVGRNVRSQLFRNIVFASEMAADAPWHVVNLVSSTQWKTRKTHAANDGTFSDPTPEVMAYLREGLKDRFSFRTWEQLHAAVVRDQAELAPLDRYLRSKSAHYRRAFDLT